MSDIYIPSIKPVHVEAFTLPEAFRKCCQSVIRHGRDYKIDEGSFKGTTRRELTYITIHIHKPGLRPICPDIPSHIPSSANDASINEYFVKYLLDKNVNPNEQYTYGKYLHDQIFEVIARYIKHGYECNQLTMNVGDMNSINFPDPPCLRLIDTRIINNALHFYIYFRSWDLWAGLPTNLGGLQLLKEFMATSIGVDDGEMLCASKGLHLYDHNMKYAKQYITL